MLDKKRDDTDGGGAQVDHRQVDVFLIPVPWIRRWMEVIIFHLLRGFESVTSL